MSDCEDRIAELHYHARRALWFGLIANDPDTAIHCLREVKRQADIVTLYAITSGDAGERAAARAAMDHAVSVLGMMKPEQTN